MKQTLIEKELEANKKLKIDECDRKIYNFIKKHTTIDKELKTNKILLIENPNKKQATIDEEFEANNKLLKEDFNADYNLEKRIWFFKTFASNKHSIKNEFYDYLHTNKIYMLFFNWFEYIYVAKNFINYPFKNTKKETVVEQPDVYVSNNFRNYPFKNTKIETNQVPPNNLDTLCLSRPSLTKTANLVEVSKIIQNSHEKRNSKSVSTGPNFPLENPYAPDNLIKSIDPIHVSINPSFRFDTLDNIQKHFTIDKKGLREEFYADYNLDKRNWFFKNFPNDKNNIINKFYDFLIKNKIHVFFFNWFENYTSNSLINYPFKKIINPIILKTVKQEWETINGLRNIQSNHPPLQGIRVNTIQGIQVDAIPLKSTIDCEKNYRMIMDQNNYTNIYLDTLGRQLDRIENYLQNQTVVSIDSSSPGTSYKNPIFKPYQVSSKGLKNIQDSRAEDAKEQLSRYMASCSNNEIAPDTPSPMSKLNVLSLDTNHQAINEEGKSKRDTIVRLALTPSFHCNKKHLRLKNKNTSLSSKSRNYIKTFLAKMIFLIISKKKGNPKIKGSSKKLITLYKSIIRQKEKSLFSYQNFKTCKRPHKEKTNLKRFHSMYKNIRRHKNYQKSCTTKHNILNETFEKNRFSNLLINTCILKNIIKTKFSSKNYFINQNNFYNYNDTTNDNTIKQEYYKIIMTCKNIQLLYYFTFIVFIYIITGLKSFKEKQKLYKIIFKYIRYNNRTIPIDNLSFSQKTCQKERLTKKPIFPFHIIITAKSHSIINRAIYLYFVYTNILHSNLDLKIYFYSRMCNLVYNNYSQNKKTKSLHITNFIFAIQMDTNQCRFGNILLSRKEKSFRNLQRKTLQNDHQILLDNLFHNKNDKGQQLRSLNALEWYLSNKVKFQYFVVLSGGIEGVYKGINNTHFLYDLNLVFYGFYELNEALDFAYKNILTEFTIDTDCKNDLQNATILDKSRIDAEKHFLLMEKRKLEFKNEILIKELRETKTQLKTLLTNQKAQSEETRKYPNSPFHPIRTFFHPRQQLDILPPHVSESIFQLAQSQFDEKVIEIHELLKKIPTRRSNSISGLAIIDTFHHNKDRCDDCIQQYCHHTLEYKIPKCDIDFETFQKIYPQGIKYPKGNITIQTLLDFGLINSILFRSDKRLLQESLLGEKIKNIIEKYQSKFESQFFPHEVWVKAHVQSVAPEWIKYGIEPAKHIVFLEYFVGDSRKTTKPNSTPYTKECSNSMPYQIAKWRSKTIANDLDESKIIGDHGSQSRLVFQNRIYKIYVQEDSWLGDPFYIPIETKTEFNGFVDWFKYKENVRTLNKIEDVIRDINDEIEDAEDLEDVD